MANDEIELSVEDGLATLTLTRPDAGNAINRSFVSLLRAHAESLHHRADVRVVVLRSTGRNFCVGGDLRYFSGLADIEPEILSLATDFHAGIYALRELDAPVLAGVQGAAAGGGLALACACDLVLAAESASFTMAYTGAGLSPDGGSSWFLTQPPRVLAPVRRAPSGRSSGCCGHPRPRRCRSSSLRKGVRSRPTQRPETGAKASRRSSRDVRPSSTAPDSILSRTTAIPHRGDEPSAPRP